MLNTEEIRIIPEFTGQTSVIPQTESDLKLRSGYWVYTSSFGGNLVDEFTVKDFLDNPNNEQVAIDFFNYLQSNFTAPEFNELYYNNVKLSNVFNDFYDTTIRANLPPTKTVANLQFTATTAVTYSDTNFINNDTRINKKITAIIGYNTGDSYYVTVPITSTYTILENQNYDKYRRNSVGNSVSKTISEEFRYVIRSGETIYNADSNVVHENLFDNFLPLPPVPQNVPQFRIQFKNDKYVIPKNSQNSLIPVEIIFDKPSPIQGQSFQIVIEESNAIPGLDFGLVEGVSDTNTFQNFYISSGQSAATATIKIKTNQLLSMDDLFINLNLKGQGNVDSSLLSSQAYSVSAEPFRIVSEQPNYISVLQNTSIDYVKNITKTAPQFLLQSFVDLNFNDSESELWFNPSTTPFGIVSGITISQPLSSETTVANTGTTTHGSMVDTGINSLFNYLYNLGYNIDSRKGVSGETITMNGNTPIVLRIITSNTAPAFVGAKLALFHMRGYDLITFNLLDNTGNDTLINNIKSFFNG